MRQKVAKVKKSLNGGRVAVLCWAASVTLCVSVCLFTSAAAAPEMDCVVTADGVTTSVTCVGGRAEDALAAAGVELLEEDNYTVQQRDDVLYIDVIRAKIVSLTVNGQTEYFRTDCTTVGELLEERGVVLDGDDTVSVGLQETVTEGMAITVEMTDVQTVTMQVDVAYQTEYREDPNAYEGETTVLQEGRNGRKQITYMITSENGVVTSLQVEQEKILDEPVNQIVATGTLSRPEEQTEVAPSSNETSDGSDESMDFENESSASEESSGGSSDGAAHAQPAGNTVQTWNGTTYTYSQVLHMTATAYTFNSGANITASGVPAQVGVIAADLSYLPMGTVVYIVSADGTWEYGYAVVGDTGVSGATVDLFFNTYDECIQFGIQDALVYVIG